MGGTVRMHLPVSVRDRGDAVREGYRKDDIAADRPHAMRGVGQK